MKVGDRVRIKDEVERCGSWLKYEGRGTIIDISMAYTPSYEVKWDIDGDYWYYSPCEIELDEEYYKQQAFDQTILEILGEE